MAFDIRDIDKPENDVEWRKILLLWVTLIVVAGVVFAACIAVVFFLTPH
jgi:hypothetical protein